MLPHPHRRPAPSGGGAAAARLLSALVATCLIAAAVLAGPVGCDRTHIESMQELAHGMRWYADGVHGKARERFKRAVDIEPNNHQAHYFLGMVLWHQLKEARTAEAHLRRAVELMPQEPEYAYQLASVLASRDPPDPQADALLRQTLQARPDHAEAHYRLGRLLCSRGGYDECIRLLTRAIELKPRFAQPYVELAALYAEYDYIDEARQVMENAARNCPRSAEAQHEYGRLLALGGAPADAVRYYRKAVELRPDYEGALFNLGMAYLAQRDERNAVHFLRRYLGRASRAKDPYRVESAELTIAKLEQPE